MIEKGWNLETVESLPFGFVLPIREMLYALRHNPPQSKTRRFGVFSLFSEWTVEGYTLIDRKDIIQNMRFLPNKKKRSDPFRDTNMLQPSRRRRLPPPEPLLRRNVMGESIPLETNKNDGFDDVISDIGPKRFEDNRLESVRRSLNTVLPSDLELSVPRDDHSQYTERIQLRLKHFFPRTLATTIGSSHPTKRVESFGLGRGAFGLNVVNSFPDAIVDVPDICLSGKVDGLSRIFHLDALNDGNI